MEVVLKDSVTQKYPRDAEASRQFWAILSGDTEQSGQEVNLLKPIFGVCVIIFVYSFPAFQVHESILELQMAHLMQRNRAFQGNGGIVG